MTQGPMLRISTPKCMKPGCTRPEEVLIPARMKQGYMDWVTGRKHIQNALPEVSAAEREQMKTGTHPECWDEMFAELEDAE